jgi:DNA-binding CsgD family transcriptional regulator
VDWLRRQRDHAVETWRLAKAEGELDALGSAAELRAFAAYILGNADELDLALGDLRQVARTTHDPFWLWRHSLMAGSKHLLNCEFTAAAESLAATRRMGASFGYRWEDMDGPWSLQSFVLRRETGALEFARAALATISPPSAWAPGLVAIHCELGMAREAREALRRTLEQGLDRLRDSVTWPASFSLLAEAAVWLADRSAAEALIADAGDFSGLNLMGAEFLAPFGSADRLLAGLKGVLGRRGVEDDFAAALELDARMHSPLHVATTQAEWAAWLRRSGARESRIEEHSAPARQLADRYGLARVRRVLGADAAGGPASRPAGLTGREREVLQLIGRGRSNREIADELFISEHTAANHVRSILMKTQTANRTAAAHYARQHGLLRDDSDDRHP